jgi:hypothetical protein
MTTVRHEPSVLPVAYPTLREAAAMIGVTPPTLSRLPDLRFLAAGGRDHRVPAAEILRLTRHFGRRSLDEVAFQLVDYCKAHAPRDMAAVEAEVDETTSALYRAATPPSIDTFLRDAQRLLPKPLLEQVIQATRGHPPEASGAHSPRRTAATVSRKAAAAAGSKPRTSSKRNVRQPA